MKLKFNLIQALRGFAAVMVVFTHVTTSTVFYYNGRWLYNIFEIGWCGVDFFFVLSGFIITYIHLKDIKQKTNFTSFLIRRFNRIYPIFWVVSIIYLLLSLAFKQVAVSNIFSPYIIKSFLLFPTLNPLVGVSWSLCYEVMFYLVFALCILLGWKATKWLALLWLTTTLTFNLFQLPIISNLVNGYVVEFLLGGCVGYILNSVVSQRIKWTIKPKVLLLVGGLVFFTAWAYFYSLPLTGRDPFESRILFGVASAIIILGAALSEIKDSISVAPIFLLLGDASYSIYLIHPLFLTTFYKVASRFFQNQTSPTFIFLLGAAAAFTAIVVGVFFHKYVERTLIKIVNGLTVSFLKKKNTYQENVALK